jgi:hypothetical protein
MKQTSFTKTYLVTLPILMDIESIIIEMVINEEKYMGIVIDT